VSAEKCGAFRDRSPALIDGVRGSMHRPRPMWPIRSAGLWVSASRGN